METFIFESKKLFFQFFSWGYNQKKDYLYFREIQKLIFNPLSFAIIFAILLQFSNYPLCQYKTAIRVFISDMAPVKFLISSNSDSDYVSFLTAISAVGSVLIGLYYAALMSVQSALYSKLPNNIRDLMSQERFGNTYIKFLAFVTFLSFSLISFRLIGFEKIYLVPLIMLIFTAISVFAFTQLGKMAFNFFDPTRLSYSIFNDLEEKIRDVRAGERYFSDPEFQKFYYKLAYVKVETLTTLYDYALEEKHLNSENLLSLNNQIFQFLSRYTNSKKYIDPKSLWYEQKFEHKNLYQVNDLELYTYTGIDPQPDIIYDIYWLEKKILPYIASSIEVNIKNANHRMVLDMINPLSIYVRTLASNLEVSFAMSFINTIEKSVVKGFEVSSGEQPKTLEMIAIIDNIMTIKIQILLIFIQRIKAPDIVEDDKLKSLNWRNKKNIYKQGFDAYLLDSINYLHERIIYEYSIQNKAITPYWFQNDILKLAKTKQIIEGFLILFSEDLFKIPEEVSNNIWVKASYIERQWLYLQQILLQIESIKNAWNILTDSRKVDFQWEQVDLQFMEENLLGIKRNLLKVIAMTSFALSTEAMSKEYPDFFGKFNSLLGDEIIQMLLTNDVELFKSIYPIFFANSLSAFYRLTPNGNLSGVFLENSMKLATGPILDILFISGYTKILSEFYESDLWNVTEEFWDKSLESSLVKIDFCAAAIGLAETGFAMAPRDSVRWKWKQSVENFLKEQVPRKEYFETGEYMRFSPLSIALHPNPLVRLFVPEERHSIFYDGIDVFIHYYLKRHVTTTLEFGRRSHRDFDNYIEHEIEKYQKYMERENDHED